MIESILSKKLKDFSPDGLEPHLSRLKEVLNGRELAVIAYGSTLSQVTRSATSTPDFYVIVPSYATFYTSFRHRTVNRFLPPNIYHFSVNGVTSKYSVISKDDFVRETTSLAKDCYTMGRMSKRIALLYPDEQLHFIATQQASAMSVVAKVGRALLP